MEAAPDMTIAKYQHPMTLYNYCVYSFGGYDGTETIPTIELYNLKEWQPIGSL